MQWEDYKQKNQEYYQTKLAKRQVKEYMQIVHGQKGVDIMTRNHNSTGWGMTTEKQQGKPASVISGGLRYQSQDPDNKKKGQSQVGLNKTQQVQFVQNNLNKNEQQQAYASNQEDYVKNKNNITEIKLLNLNTKIADDSNQQQSPLTPLISGKLQNSFQKGRNSMLPQLDKSQLLTLQNAPNAFDDRKSQINMNLTPQKSVIQSKRNSLVNLQQHQRVESLPNLGKQRYLQKLFDESYGPSIKPQYQQFSKEPKIYNTQSLNRQQDITMESGGQSPGQRSLMYDANVQGMEQIKYYKRLDDQTEKQRKIYERHLEKVDSNSTLSQHRKIDNTFTLNMKPITQTNFGKGPSSQVSSFFTPLKNKDNLNASTAVMSKADVQSQYKELIDQYKKTSTDQKRMYNSMLKNSSSIANMIQSSSVPIGSANKEAKNKDFDTMYL
eukprot:403338089